MIMNSELETLYSRASDTFEEMISDMQLNLLETNEEYNKIDAINRELRSKNPKIALAFDREQFKDLTADEFKMLVEIMDNNLLLKKIELEKMFMLGNKEAFYYFNRMGIIENEDATQ